MSEGEGEVGRTDVPDDSLPHLTRTDFAPTGGDRGCRNTASTADAIVVLGCRGSAALRHRLERGIELFRHGAAPLLVLSGGGTGPVAEAEIMHRAALGCGIPAAALLIETGSRNTFENARETARLLASRGLHSVLLVSDRIHLPRATILFRLAGLRVAGRAGVPPPSMRWETRVAIHEFTALPRSLSRALLASLIKPLKRMCNAGLRWRW